ncbi:MAG: ATP-binding protein, partial [Acidobacteriota bacterium]
PLEGLPEGVYYALYDASGRAVRGSWADAPPLSAEQLADGALLETARGGLRVYTAPDPVVAGDGPTVTALMVPVVAPLGALERVASHAFGALAVIAVLAAFVFVLSVSWPRMREMATRGLRSYARRLLLVHGALILIPLVALALVLVRGFEERARGDQFTDGAAALRSARTMVRNFIIGRGEGYAFDPELSADFLSWTADVVQHQVNLYWGSRLWASSQQELFTAGLLPRRIPGDIYARLAMRGPDVASRSRRAGDLTYLELYTPIAWPGVPDGEPLFYLSLPRVEQQAEVSRELAAMRRQTVLVTSALFLLLVALGGRLTRSFTAPLMDVVRGTRRIARGASSLGITPRDTELSTLVAAIDDMAGRIAASRRALLVEKQLVDRMVDNITSGVVSLDRAGRVLMHNRVARILLGTEIGAPFERVLDSGRLEPVRPLLDEARQHAESEREPRQTTVALADDDGTEHEWTLTWVPLPGVEDPAALLVVDDVSEVLAGQRLAAWAEMARIIAHEIKNPLTPIRLSAEHLRGVYRQSPDRLEEVFDRCIDNVLVHVEELRMIASEFSTYSRIPRAERVPGDLVEALGALAEAYRDAAERGVGVSFESAVTTLSLRFDRALLGRAVRNLVENALRVSRDTVVLTLDIEQATARIAVCDRGPGVSPENLTRIFEPYFSTHDSGTGLGLPIARRIVEEHEGTISARNRSGGGLEVVITIPLAADNVCASSQHSHDSLAEEPS